MQSLLRTNLFSSCNLKLLKKHWKNKRLNTKKKIIIIVSMISFTSSSSKFELVIVIQTFSWCSLFDKHRSHSNRWRSESQKSRNYLSNVYDQWNIEQFTVHTAHWLWSRVSIIQENWFWFLKWCSGKHKHWWKGNFYTLNSMALFIVVITLLTKLTNKQILQFKYNMCNRSYARERLNKNTKAKTKTKTKKRKKETRTTSEWKRCIRNRWNFVVE